MSVCYSYDGFQVACRVVNLVCTGWIVFRGISKGS